MFRLAIWFEYVTSMLLDALNVSGNSARPVVWGVGMATSLPTRHPGNPAVRDFRGASRNVRHGETVNPPAIERAEPETPHLQRGALDLYPNRGMVGMP